MANMQFANNAVTTLVSGITNVATSITVTSAVAFPTLTGAQYFYCTFIDAATGLVIEIVKVTAVVASVFTIVRAQDGTTASAYLTGDKVELRLTRASLNDFPKLDEDNIFTASLTATGFAGALNGSLGATTASTAVVTSINKMAITAPATSSTLAVADGKTHTVNNSIALSGTDSTTMTFPTTSATIARTDAAQTFTGTQTFGETILGTNAAKVFNSGGVSIGNSTDPGATNLSVTGQIITGGNVGINVTPSAWVSAYRTVQLQGGAIASNSASGLLAACNSYSNGTNWIYTNTGFASQYWQTSGQHQWFTAPSGTGGNAITLTQAMTLDASGNLGIGTTSPTSKIHAVMGAADGIIAQFSGGGSNYNRITVSNTVGSAITGFIQGDVNGGSPVVKVGALTNHPLVLATNDTERMRISNTGIVTMSAYGAGAATFSAAGVISSVSDETWKVKDGVPLNPDAMLQKLEPGYWYYNDEKKEIFGADRQLGFYAQNVNQAIGVEAAPIPEEGKPWGYYDRSVLAVTVMSLQKALATIESLTARLEALEGK